MNVLSRRTRSLCFLSALISGATWAGCSSEAASDGDADTSEDQLSSALSIFGNVVPAHPADPDGSAVTLGVKFEASVSGRIVGLRFYKGAGNGGQHTGQLWNAAGQRLATVTFTNETASGWQRATLSAPVAVKPGQIYVASYLAPAGHYAGDTGYFATSGHASGPLYAARDGESGANGVYAYGSSAAFPTSTWHSANYYVDVLFRPDSAPGADGGTTPPPPPVDAGSPVDSGGGATDAGGPVPPNVLGCAAHPHTCGYPDATNSGVLAGTALRRVPADVTSGTGWAWSTQYGGHIEVTGAGSVLDGLDVSGTIEVKANNVTVKNTRISASGESSAIGLIHADSATISHCTISSPVQNGAGRLLVGVKDTYGDTNNAHIVGNDISHASTAIQIANGVFEDNYIHDYGFTTGDHLNGITVGGGDLSPLMIRHNTIFDQVGQTDAIALFQDFGNEANKTIDDNLLAGGGYCIYAGAGSKGTPNDIRVTNNRISPLFFPAGGSYGWLAAWVDDGPGNVHSGNVWDDTGHSADADFTTHK